MSNIITRFKYFNFTLYCFVFYSFFTQLSCKKDFYKVNGDTEGKIISNYSVLNVHSKKSKIFLDLKYKDLIDSYSLSRELFSCNVDLEGKLLGYKMPAGKKLTPNLSNTTMCLNKKLVNSTLFGSIKLIKL